MPRAYMSEAVADILVMIIVGHVEQLEHMPSRWCPGFAGRRRCDGDQTPDWMRPEVDMHAGKKATCRLRRYVSR
jgi:hypothetical protein